LLQNSPQLNIEIGLRSFNGQREQYLQMLKRFLTLHRGDALLIDAEVAKEDRETACRLAHTLKGVAGLLGLEQVQATAALLEQKLNSSLTANDVGLLTRRLRECLHSGEAAILKLIDEPQMETLSITAAFELGQQVILLESELATYSLTALDIWREIKPQLSVLIGSERLNILHWKLEQYDLPGALEDLRGIMEEHPQLQGYSSPE
jgi:HPt (histidine-containing phosphotransfer) domain-containing protein